MQTGNRVGLLHDEHNHLTNKDKVKAETLNDFLLSVSNTSGVLWDTPSPELGNYECENEKLPEKPELQWDLLVQLDPYKSMGPDETHPRLLKDLADVIMKLLSRTFQESWASKRSQAIESWQMSQSSRRANGMILITTGLSASLQCQAELWRRLFWNNT
ncbi:hypothetical protein WISP_41002 [Willisornis vidua]|uniref:Uncharacterized protein n=1 Tax=Willisornis vidua TaxID=1566151 RepID=A0ABQ9DLC9_9PASS|nr:hypothetical protein WISP_41002 [Willisornis vidua]